MTWVKLDDQFPDHPKVLACTPEAMWLYVAGLCWCSRHLTDGKIPKPAIARLTAAKRPEKLAGELVDAGLWVDRDSHYEVHDFLDYQPSKSQVESQRASQRDRQQKSRARRGVSADTPSRPGPVPGESSSSSPTSTAPPTEDDEVLRELATLRLAARQSVDRLAPISDTTAWQAKAMERDRAELNGQVGRARAEFPEATAAELARYLFDGRKPAANTRPTCPAGCGATFDTIDARDGHYEICEGPASAAPTRREAAK